jgi:NADH:ubiquinone oxidoreductase subunit 2 (subunit N)
MSAARASIAVAELPRLTGSSPGADDRRQIVIAPRGTANSAFYARFAVLNLVGAALILASWGAGWLYRPYAADSSGMCWLITVLFACGLVSVLRKDWKTVRWSGNALVYLGMVGTVLGLIITVSDLSADKGQSFDDFKQVVTAIYVGSATALYTNLLACIGYLWLGTNAHLLAREEV